MLNFLAYSSSSAIGLVPSFGDSIPEIVDLKSEKTQNKGMTHQLQLSFVNITFLVFSNEIYCLFIVAIQNMAFEFDELLVRISVIKTIDY